MSNSIVAINSDKHTASAKSLWEALGKPWSRFDKWFEQYRDYGFIENTDFKAYGIKTPHANGRDYESTDYEITIDMAKELAMLQKSEQGKRVRLDLINLEKQWNTPEAVMARALQVANNTLERIQTSYQVLETENKLLAQQSVEWADRKVLEALVKAYGSSIGFEDAWREFKKELLYNHSININSRVTNYMNTSGKKTKPKTLSMIHDEELAACISTAVAMCRNHNVKIEHIINKQA